MVAFVHQIGAVRALGLFETVPDCSIARLVAEVIGGGERKTNDILTVVHTTAKVRTEWIDGQWSGSGQFFSKSHHFKYWIVISWILSSAYCKQSAKDKQLYMNVHGWRSFSKMFPEIGKWIQSTSTSGLAAKDALLYIKSHDRVGLIVAKGWIQETSQKKPGTLVP